jgi:hypothetical protein
MKITPNSVLVLLSVLASAHAFTLPQKSHPTFSQPKLARPACLPKVTTAPKHGDSTSLSMIEFSSELVAESGVNLFNALLPLAIFASSIALSVKDSSPRVEIDWTATAKADAVTFAQPQETPVTVAPVVKATPKPAVAIFASSIAVAAKNPSPRVEMDSTATRKAESTALAQPQKETPVTVAAAASSIALSVKSSSPQVEMDSTAARKAEPTALAQPQEETPVTVAPVASSFALTVKNSSPQVEMDSTATRKAEPTALAQPQEETPATVAPVASSFALTVKNSSPQVERDWTASRKAEPIALAQPQEETPVTVAPAAKAALKPAMAIFASSVARAVKNSNPRVEMDSTSTRKAEPIDLAQPQEAPPVTVVPVASSIALPLKNSSPRVEIDSTAARKAEPIALAEPHEEIPVTVTPVAKGTPKPAGIRSFREMEKVNYMAAVDEREALRCKEVDVPATKAKRSVAIQTVRFFFRGFAFPFRGLKRLFS